MKVELPDAPSQDLVIQVGKHFGVPTWNISWRYSDELGGGESFMGRIVLLHNGLYHAKTSEGQEADWQNWSRALAFLISPRGMT